MDQQDQGLAPPPDDGAPPEELKSKEREQSESEARGGKGDKGDRSRSREGRKKSRRSRSNSRSDERRRRRSRSRSGHRSRSRSRDRRRRERHRRSRSRSRGDRRRRSRSRDRRRRSHSRSPPRSARGPPRAPAAAASSGPQRFFDGFRWIERTVADDPAVLATALNKTRAERRLYVGNLPIGITDMDLKAFFDGALKPILGGVDDAVLSVWLSPSSESQKPYAFVEFATIEGAATALQYLNGKECLGNALRIARPNS